MEARHTPGPWEFVNEEVSGHLFQFVRAPGTIVENNRGPSYARQILSDEDYPEKAADATLIAASPDLLEALAGLLSVAEMTTFSDQFPRECEVARAAISRATGEGE